jgi:hypothetical protein
MDSYGGTIYMNWTGRERGKIKLRLRIRMVSKLKGKLFPMEYTLKLIMKL